MQRVCAIAARLLTSGKMNMWTWTHSCICAADEVFEGDATIVTVPLGVLKARAVKFIPSLPPWKAEAIQQLGFGTLNKVLCLLRHNCAWATSN